MTCSQAATARVERGTLAGIDTIPSLSGMGGTCSKVSFTFPRAEGTSWPVSGL